MSTDFFDNEIKQHLIPVQIPNRENWLWDIRQIQDNVTGRIDASVANTFLFEATQLLFNSILLFEQGLFDCAYYSLRQAIELSTTMVYLSDMPREIQKRKLKDWNTDKNFPFQSQMLRELKEKGSVFSDMKQKMPLFFSELYKTYSSLNKLVHKQGIHRFYRYKHFYSPDKTKHLNDFLFYLEKTIGIIAMMRLSIDPFPILLLDDEIYHRIFETLSDGYSQKFIDKYMGASTINEYKQTELFQGAYQHIMKLEKRTPCVSDIVWNQFIDMQREKEIRKQFHLMSQTDQIAVYLAFMCKTTTRVYVFGGLRRYHTSLLPSDTVFDIYSSAEFDKYFKALNKYNQSFHHLYLSAFQYEDNDFLVEHLQPISEQCISEINKDFSIKSSDASKSF